MSITLDWSDFPEKYDDPSLLSKITFDSDSDFTSPDTHFLIKGDNYPSLILLDKQLHEKIDFIYIDPPYNTGNTFTYNDTFSSSTYKHSSWLSFMKRRLILARQLLSESGVIFIAIGQAELFYLKILCDLIFYEDNFINDFMWLHGKGKKNTWSRTMEQHTLCYAKNKSKLKPFTDVEISSWAKTNPDGDSRGNWFSGSISFSEKRSNPNHKNFYTIVSPSKIEWTRQWLVSKEEMQKYLQNKQIFFGAAPTYNKVPRLKIFNNTESSVIPKNIITGMESTRQAQNHLDEILGEKKLFDNPKPVELIKHLLFITNLKKDALILDFFAGSGTTFESVLEMNQIDDGKRKCILIQKDEKTWIYENGAKTAKKGSQVAFEKGFDSIADITEKRIQKNLQAYKSKYGINDKIEIVNLKDSE